MRFLCSPSGRPLEVHLESTWRPLTPTWQCKSHSLGSPASPYVARVTKESSAEAQVPGMTAREASRKPGRTSAGRPARVIVCFGALLGDTPGSSGSMFCGIWTSKWSSRDAGKQCGGPGTRQDSQKGIQEAREDVNRAPSSRYSTFWGDTPDGSRSMYCGIGAFKSASGDAGKQCGGPGTTQDSQKGVQEAREDGNTFGRTFGRHSGQLREHVLWQLGVQKCSGGRMKAVRRHCDQAG